MRAEKASVSKHVEGALLGALAQAALYLVQHRPMASDNSDSVGQTGSGVLEAAHKYISELSGLLLLRLGSEQAETKDGNVALALKTIAAIAPGLSFSFVSMGGDGGVDGVLVALVQAAEQNISALSNSLAARGEEVGRTGLAQLTERRLLFLLAVASTIHAAGGGGSDVVSVFVLRTVPDVVLQYPYLSEKLRLLLSHCLCLLLQGASRADVAVAVTGARVNTLLADVLEVLVSCLIARSISVVDADEEISADAAEAGGEMDGRLCGTYVGLWADILAPSQARTRAAVACTEPSYTVAAGRLCDALFTHWLRLLGALDLAYSTAAHGRLPEGAEQEQVHEQELAECLEASNPADQELLINFASLAEQLLPQVLAGEAEGACSRCLKHWIDALLDQVLVLAETFPLVSALYRLARLLLVAGEASFGFVSAVVAPDGAVRVVAADDADGDGAVRNVEELEIAMERVDVLLRLRTCLGVLVRRHLGGMRDELLDCALRLLFDAPHGAAALGDLLPAAAVALASERQVAAAVACMSRSVGESELESHLPRLLPLLNKFILTSYADKESAGGPDLKELSLRRATGAVRQREGSFAADYGMGAGLTGAELQRAILGFMGRLGGLSRLMLPEPQDVLRASLHWAPDAPVPLKLPFGVGAAAGGMELPLDALLPRLVELCGQSGDAGARVAAAQGLHGALSYMVGAAATSPTRGRVGVQSPFAVHYRNIFPAVLGLAASATGVCRELFAPLLRQLVHWFSGANQVHADEALALIDSLVEGLCGSDSGVRELACEALDEFVKWAVKQSTKAELAIRPQTGGVGSPSSVHALLERLFVLAAHPTEERRLGAALVFGRVHLHLRGETVLVSAYAMRILHALLRSLKLCAQISASEGVGDGDSNNIPARGAAEARRLSPSSNGRLRDELMEAADRYETAIARLASDSTARDLAKLADKGFLHNLAPGGGLNQSTSAASPAACPRHEFPFYLHDLVGWLWEGTAYPDPHFRRCCMKTFAALCPLLWSPGEAGPGGAHSGPERIAVYVSARLAPSAGLGVAKSKLLKRGSHHSVAGTGAGSDIQHPSELNVFRTAILAITRTALSPGGGRVGLRLRAGCMEEAALLAAVDAHLDVHNWLFKLRFVGPQQMATLLQPGVCAAPCTPAASAPTKSKKRKAADCNQDGGGDGSAVGGAVTEVVSVLDDLREFLRFCREPRVGVDAAGAPERRAEVMLRALQFLCTVFTPGPDFSEEAAALALAVWAEGALTPLLVGLLMNPGGVNREGSGSGLTAPFFLDSAQSPVTGVLIPQQSQQLLSICRALRDSGLAGSSMREVIQEVCASLRVALVEALDCMIQLESSQAEVLGCARTVAAVRAAGLMEEVFREGEGEGEDGTQVSAEELLLEYGFRVVHAASLLTEHASVKQVQVGRTYLELAVTLGVPFAASISASGVDSDPETGYSFMSVLTLPTGADSAGEDDAACLALFVDRYLDGIVEQALLGGRSCSLFATNAPALISAYCRAQAYATGSGGVAVAERGDTVLARVLHRAVTLLLVYSDDDSLSATEQTALKRDAVCCFEHASDGFRTLPSAMLLQVLELDATVADLTFRSRALFSFVSQRCLAVLPRSKDTEELVAHLRLLAYILPGCVQSCPLPLSTVSAAPAFCYPQGLEAEVVDALEEMVANHFPLKPVSPAPGVRSDAWTGYSLLLRVYLELLAGVGAVCLLQPLVSSLRLGRAHHYWPWIAAALAQMVDAVDTGEGHCGSGDTSAVSFPALQVLYRACVDVMLDEGENVPVKRAYFDGVCLPLLRRASDAGLVGIFTSPSGGGLRPSCIIKQLVETIQKPLGSTGGEAMSLSDSLPAGVGPGSALLEAARVSTYVQGCAYSLLAALYDRCSLASIKRELTTAYCHAGLAADAVRPVVTGKELTVAICRVAHKAVRSTRMHAPQGSREGGSIADAVTEEQTIQQQLWSNAYNCLCIVVAKTQADEQFFDKFLFKEQASEMFWYHVIDTGSRQYGEFPAVQEKFVVGTLGHSSGSSQGRHSVSATARGAWARTGGLLSQYFSDSVLGSCSLVAAGAGTRRAGGFAAGGSDQSAVIGSGTMASQLLTSDNYCVEDLAATQCRPGGEKMELDSLGSQLSAGGSDADTGAAWEGGPVSGWDDCLIEFEYSHVNQQPVMPVLVRVVQRMASLGRAKWEAMETLPGWLAVCKDKLCDYSTVSGHVNIRLFMLRLMLNQPVAAIVRKWAGQLLPAVLHCCLRDLCSDPNPNRGSGGDESEGLSYFLRDVVDVLCSEWAGAPLTGEAAPLAARLLSHVLRHVYDPNATILRQNSRAARELIRLWVGTGTGQTVDGLDLGPIAELLSEAAAPTGGAYARASSRGSEAVKKRLVGLELTLALLKGGYPLLSARTHGSCADRLLAGVVSSIGYPRREVAEFACLVAGMLLEAIERNHTEAQAHAQATAVASRRHRQGGTQAVHGAGPDVLVPGCVNLRAQVDAIVAGLLSQKDGADLVAMCLRALTTTRPAALGPAGGASGSGNSLLRREVVLKMISVFTRLKPRGKMDLLEALVHTRSSFDGLSIAGCLRPFAIALLADISSVVIGRGGGSQRLPLVQIMTLRLLSKHQAELDDDYVRLLLGASPAEGLQLATGEHSVLQVREEAFCLLMRLCDRLSAVAAGGPRPTLLRSVRALLLRGLTDSDADGMEIATSPQGEAGEGGSTSASVSITTAAEGKPRIGIRRFVFEYCHRQFDLGDSPQGRLNGLLRELVDATETESAGGVENWVFYSAHLLVAAFQGAPGYSQRLFSTSLADEGSYVPLYLDAGKRGTGADLASVPMFALERTQVQLRAREASQWLSSASLGSSEHGTAAATTQSVDRRRHRSAGFLRATQERTWTQTQTYAARVSASQDQDVGVGLSARRASPLVQRLMLTNWSQRPSGASARDALGAGAGSMGPPVGLPLYITRRRVPTGGGKVARVAPVSSLSSYSQSFSSLCGASDTVDEEADSSVALDTVSSSAYDEPGPKRAQPARNKYRQRGQGSRQSQLQVQAKKVVMYRTYRVGELPDIGVTLGGIFGPVQGALARDAGMANVVLALLVSRLYGRGSDVVALNEPAAVELRRNLVSALAALAAGAATGTGSSIGQCVAALLSACAHGVQCELAVLKAGAGRKALAKGAVEFSLLTTLPTVEVADLAIATSCCHAAVRLLEEYLLLLAAAEESAGTDAGSGPSAMLVWIQLARLYADLDEEDILLGIVGRIETTEPAEQRGEGPKASRSLVTQAIDCEFAGKFGDALELYRRLAEGAEAARVGAMATEYGGGAAMHSADVAGAQGEMWASRSVRCMYQLLDWGGVRAHVEAHTPREGASLALSLPQRVLTVADARQRDVLLGHYLRALVHSCLASPAGVNTTEERAQDREELDELMDALAADTTGAVVGISGARGLAGEFAAASALRGEWVRAKGHVLAGLEGFSTGWSALNACALAAKRGLLGELQRLAELGELASCNIGAAAAPVLKVGKNRTGGIMALRSGSAELVRSLAGLLDAWAPSAPATGDSLWAWDAVANTRHLAFDQMRGELSLVGTGPNPEGNDAGADRLLQPAAARIVAVHVATGLAAVRQEVLPVVRAQLTLANLIRNDVWGSGAELTLGEVEVVYRYNGRQIVEELGRCSSSTSGPDLQKISGMFEKNVRLLDAMAAQLLGSTPSAVGERREAAQVTLMRGAWLAQWSRCGIFDGPSRRGKQKEALKIYRDFVGTSADTELRNQAFGQLARHTHSMLHTDLGQELGEEPQLEVARVALRSFASGLRCGDHYCREHVMIFTDLLGRHTGAAAELLEQLPAIPRWVFLKYAAQLMGSLDKQEGPAAARILEHVAAEFPSALYYPFKITAEFLGSGGTEQSVPLRALLHNSTLDMFVASLNGLTHPDQRWSDGVKALQKMLADAQIGSSKIGVGAQTAILATFRALKEETTTLAWDGVGNKIGDYNAKWARDHRAQVDQLAGMTGEKLFTPKTMESLLALKDLRTGEHVSGRAPLGAFSSWLTEVFDPAVHKIPVPGHNQHQHHHHQHQHQRQSGAEEHLVGFDPQLLVMSSVRRPKRLRVYTSHGRELLYLVKGGEDLRNDERIEQLFGLMNSIVADRAGADAGGRAATDSSLRARTYEVVPMTSKVGVLEWVRNTVPIKRVIMDEMGRCEPFLLENPGARRRKDADIDLGGIAATGAWAKWMGGDVRHYKTYHNMTTRVSAQAARKKFRELEALVPSDLLRRRLLSMAPSPEAFVTLRAEFGKSLAVSNLFGYILGIGDRHLDNLLLDTSSGSVVQIDFGVCFGMGSSVLPVPELLPFRLTAQLRGALSPLDGAVLLRGHMVACLDRLRAEQGVEALANALEIYVNDPVVDWLKYCKPVANQQRQAADSASTSGSSDASSGGSALSGVSGMLDKDMVAQLAQEPEWEPRRRINNAMRKLRGAHPALVMADELRCNVHIAGRKGAPVGLLESYCTAATGLRSAAALQETLSSGEQASALIDMATDPNILARQFVGLMSWV